MQVTFDTKKWKFDPKFWAAVLALFGVTNFTELVDWVHGRFFSRSKIEVAVLDESNARKAADSLILGRLDGIDNQMVSLRDSLGDGLTRVAVGLRKTQDYLLRVPQVRAYDRAQAREDSLRREHDRIRRETFERDARGPGGPTSREFR